MNSILMGTVRTSWQNFLQMGLTVLSKVAEYIIT